MAPQSSLPGELAELREHAMRLANDLAGPLRRVTVRSGDLSIEVEWGQPADPGPWPVAALMSGPAQALLPGPAAGEAVAGNTVAENQVAISSPMVGTFYRSPSPDAAPFVEVGDLVEPGQTVAIIEAMKLFNPITAEHSGVVAAVLADSGQPVEFGQLLLLIAATELADASATGKE
jgi:acetyl-CoA carboxylase biotin carboxyl carrier protein